jgi:CHAT domain-containing protein
MWVVAHGGLGLDARHFARVSDDLGERHQAGDLIAACAGADLVVLLVCSGGRESHELFVERVRGLPSELLRRGVRTVVASPWPLDVLVGTRWSQAFAARLRAGDSAAQAAFTASRSLSDRHPRDRLAMHVYGDPWLRVTI